jgi:UPF0271 protein
MRSSKLPKINCDLGEGIANEQEIFPWIDCGSIACGGHFGDEASIASSLKLALANGVKVGAHPSYPDQENFGRKSMKLDLGALTASLNEQIDRFQLVANQLGMPSDHIKFHGALYNDAMANAELAQNLCKWLSLQYKRIPIFVSPGSQMLFWAEQFGLKTRLEVFGDRAYQANYQLVARSEADSLFTTMENVDAHIRPILLERQILTSTGKKIPAIAETVCFHGDNPGLMNFLPIIRKKYWK